MAKAKAKKTTKKYSELTNPTSTSRALTWILLIALPILGFIFGMRYQESRDNLTLSGLDDYVQMQQEASPSAE